MAAFQRFGRATAVAVTLAALVGGAPAAVAQGAIAFNAPVFVDTVRAGGEPEVIYSAKGRDLAYTSHEGTTHLDRIGAVEPARRAGVIRPGANSREAG